jgi:hypothetical protein
VLDPGESDEPFIIAISLNYFLCIRVLVQKGTSDLMLVLPMLAIVAIPQPENSGSGLLSLPPDRANIPPGLRLIGRAPEANRRTDSFGHGPVPASTLAASRGTNLAYQHKKSGIPQRYARLQPSITTHLEENSLLVSQCRKQQTPKEHPQHRSGSSNEGSAISPYRRTLNVYSRS